MIVFQKGMINTMLQTTRTNHSFHWSSGGATRLILSKAKSTAKPELNWNAGCKECYNLDYLCLNGNSIRQIEAARKRLMAQHRTIQLFTSTGIEKKRKGEKSGEQRGTKWIQREQFPLSYRLLLDAWTHPLQHPHQAKSINQLRDKWEHNPVLPAVVGRYTLEFRCDWTAGNSRRAMGKNNKRLFGW